MTPLTAPEPVISHTAMLLTLLLTDVQEAFDFKRFPNKITFLKLSMLFSKTAITFFEMKAENVLCSQFGYLLAMQVDSVASEEKTGSEKMIGVE